MTSKTSQTCGLPPRTRIYLKAISKAGVCAHEPRAVPQTTHPAVPHRLLHLPHQLELARQGVHQPRRWGYVAERLSGRVAPHHQRGLAAPCSSRVDSGEPEMTILMMLLVVASVWCKLYGVALFWGLMMLSCAFR